MHHLEPSRRPQREKRAMQRMGEKTGNTGLEGRIDRGVQPHGLGIGKDFENSTPACALQRYFAGFRKPGVPGLNLLVLVKDDHAAGERVDDA
ncbi:MAG TPA: hypothetical protein VHV26_17940 [Rhizomicrobium sp.]|nr:hypothetical protein [Rhizomicrobium sp.]